MHTDTVLKAGLQEEHMTCDDCRWKTERHECPWDYQYDKEDVDYAEDCTDFRNVNNPWDAFTGGADNGKT